MARLKPACLLAARMATSQHRLLASDKLAEGETSRPFFVGANHEKKPYIESRKVETKPLPEMPCEVKDDDSKHNHAD